MTSQKQKGFNLVRKSCPRQPCSFWLSRFIIFQRDWRLVLPLVALAGGNMTLAGLMGAIGLAIGIGLQNVPEGAALSIPIRADGKSRIKAFYWGSMSAIVEPIGAVMGAALVLWMMVIIPYALAFAAGAMIFVVTEELIPESQTNGNTDVATLGLMVGFVVMMVMDVALG